MRSTTRRPWFASSAGGLGGCGRVGRHLRDVQEAVHVADRLHRPAEAVDPAGRAGHEALPAVVARRRRVERELDRAVRVRHRARRVVALVLRVVGDARDRRGSARAAARRTCARRRRGRCASTGLPSTDDPVPVHALRPARGSGCAGRSRRRSCRSSRGRSRSPGSFQTVSRFHCPLASLIRYETQSGFGLSFGPTAATVWIVEVHDRRGRSACCTGTVYAGEPASVVSFET